jgi:pimeloyl-ACP methyl ester carboxylesterase
MTESHLDAKLVDVGGASHMVAGDQNDAFSEAVVDFLRPHVRPTFPDRWAS